MRNTIMGWVVGTFAVAAVLAVPSDARSQSSPSIQRATEFESQAFQLLDERDRWAYAANLYWAAAELRADEDPQVQENLRIAANLALETGNPTGAITVLESAASRALASGDVVQAAGVLADAAWVASKAGLRRDQRRLGSEAIRLADSSELTRAERDQILSRFRGA